MFYYNCATTSIIDSHGAAWSTMGHASTYAIVVDSISHGNQVDDAKGNPSIGAIA